MIIKFLFSYIKWMFSGYQTRSPYHIARIYNKKCKPCPFFKANKKFEEGECGICGCRLSPTGEVLNKIAWKTEKCPDNPPRWE
jgi:hypothetical protein